MLNEDYRDMLQALVGVCARLPWLPRATMDIDIWVMPAPDNAESVLRAPGNKEYTRCETQNGLRAMAGAFSVTT